MASGEARRGPLGITQEWGRHQAVESLEGTMTVRVVHYLNQFFAGEGGDEAAGMPLRVVDGPVRSGALLQELLGDRGEVVGTLVCGDNYANEETESALNAAGEALDRLKPDVVIAGPAFNAGRYGLACGEIGQLAERRGIKAVAAMHEENPGVAQHRRDVYILKTGESPTEMKEAATKMASFALKLAMGEDVGPAAEEGYVARTRKMVWASEPVAKRAMDMLAAKVNGRPFETEIPVILPDRVEPASPIADMTKATIALVTTGGLIPRGNPERQTAGNPERYYTYSIEGMTALDGSDWEAYHGGYFNGTASDNPNYILPLQQLRMLEDQGVVGSIHPTLFTMPGVGTPVPKSRRLGSQIAEELVENDVDGALLVAT